MKYNFVVLIILDGVGVAKANIGNAVTLAKPKNLSKLWINYPHCYLHASGEYVGLPKGVVGNSEVGHTNIGAGTIVYQNLIRINKYIQNGDLTRNLMINEIISKCKSNPSKRIHLIGLIGDGAVHSHQNHIISLIEQFGNNVKNKILLHAFSDGRDTDTRVTLNYINELQKYVPKYNFNIASVMGRSYGMDRNLDWSKTQTAYDCIVNSKSDFNTSIEAHINDMYKSDITDEFIKPYIVNKDYSIREEDIVIFFNFRSDRMIQLCSAFVMDDFNYFPVKLNYKNLDLYSFVEFSKSFSPKIKPIFPRNDIERPIGRIISEYGYKQLRISESEKFPHITYFFNGGRNIIFNGENRINIPSPEVPSYDLKPEMSAFEITETSINKIIQKEYKFIVINFANGDMVGHTGCFESAQKAIEVVDECLGKLVERLLELDFHVLITADHGNAEQMIDYETDMIKTSHTMFPVECIYVANDSRGKRLIKNGKLSDIAPTVLKLLNLNIPPEMSAEVLTVT